MKKYFSLFMAILFLVVPLSGCTNTTASESVGDDSEISASTKVDSAESLPRVSVPTTEDIMRPAGGGDTRPVLRNVLEAAAFYQQPENKDVVLTYGRYVLDLDYVSFTSVADVYSNEVQIPFTFVGEAAAPGRTERFVDSGILGFDINDYCYWVFYSEPNPDGYLVNGIDPDEYGIDFSSEYAFVTLNRPVEMLSVHHAIDKDGNELIPYQYEYGTLTDSNPRRPTEESIGEWVWGTPGDYDNLRCVFSNEYHQDILYIYTIPHSAPPFNIRENNNIAYNEYSQVEIN